MGKGRYTESGRKKAEKIKALLLEKGYGLTQWQLAEELGYKNTRGGLESVLASLQKSGVLVSEDEKGRIWLFEERYYSVEDHQRWR